MHPSIEDSNYRNDHRVQAQRKWYDSIDERTMQATLTIYFMDMEDMSYGEETIQVPVTYEVCTTCNGRGTHVNPSVDCNGLTAQDFADDPDLMESYMSGVYDVACYGCGGKRVQPVLDEARIQPDLLKRIHQERSDRAETRRMHDAERRYGA